MTTARFYLYNDTRLMMFQHRRRVFFRRLFAGVAFVLALGAAQYFGG